MRMINNLKIYLNSDLSIEIFRASSCQILIPLRENIYENYLSRYRNVVWDNVYWRLFNEND